MNTLRNSVQLIGNLGKDIEIKTFENGNSVANFSLATSEYYLNSEGEKVQNTQWHSIVAWGKKGELMKSTLSKGSQVLIQGKLTYRSYEDKEGTKKYVTEVVAENFFRMSKEASKEA